MLLKKMLISPLFYFSRKQRKHFFFCFTRKFTFLYFDKKRRHLQRILLSSSSTHRLFDQVNDKNMKQTEFIINIKLYSTFKCRTFSEVFVCSHFETKKKLLPPIKALSFQTLINFTAAHESQTLFTHTNFIFLDML